MYNFIRAIASLVKIEQSKSSGPEFGTQRVGKVMEDPDATQPFNSEEEEEDVSERSHTQSASSGGENGSPQPKTGATQDEEEEEEEEEAVQEGPFAILCNQYFEVISNIIHSLHNKLVQDDKVLDEMTDEIEELVDKRKEEALETQKWLAKVAGVQEALQQQLVPEEEEGGSSAKRESVNSPFQLHVGAVARGTPQSARGGQVIGEKRVKQGRDKSPEPSSRSTRSASVSPNEPSKGWPLAGRGAPRGGRVAERGRGGRGRGAGRSGGRSSSSEPAPKRAKTSQSQSPKGSSGKVGCVIPGCGNSLWGKSTKGTCYVHRNFEV